LFLLGGEARDVLAVAKGLDDDAIVKRHHAVGIGGGGAFTTRPT
jgi:hypothetical protein